ncbi:ABC transporter C family member 3 [Raphanus sativus]|nr:ABC transporter C family member 3 [Raphanus sativus]
MDFLVPRTLTMCLWFLARSFVAGSVLLMVIESLKDKRGFGLSRFCSLALSLLNLLFTSLSGFYWYESDVLDEEKLVLSRRVSITKRCLGGFCRFPCIVCSDYEQRKSPLLLRIWLGFYLAVSCYSLVVDTVMYKRHVHLLVYDIVSVGGALLLGYVAFFKKARGGNGNGNSNGGLEEPLLNGASTVVMGGVMRLLLTLELAFSVS